MSPSGWKEWLLVAVIAGPLGIGLGVMSAYYPQLAWVKLAFFAGCVVSLCVHVAKSVRSEAVVPTE